MGSAAATSESVRARSNSVQRAKPRLAIGTVLMCWPDQLGAPTKAATRWHPICLSTSGGGGCAITVIAADGAVAHPWDHCPRRNHAVDSISKVTA